MSRRNHVCWDPDSLCDWCDRRAEDRKEAADEPLSEAEIEDRENAFEAAMDRMWES